jgi:hypothetical protein
MWQVVPISETHAIRRVGQHQVNAPRLQQREDVSTVSMIDNYRLVLVVRLR